MTPELAAACLASLPDATPARTRDRLARHPDPCDALRVVCASGSIDAAPLAERLRARGTRAFWIGGPQEPIGPEVPDRPAVLLAEGERAEALAGPRVAVVGTRSASPHGIADARELGGVLAAAGVTVVSGLAIGIDAAAHQGALDEGGEVVGVLGTGLDIVYPRRHLSLFAQVRSRGLLMSEYALGVEPAQFRFPVRNRIIAALADAVVVVEATTTGGARITAERALDYGRPVLAIPGSRRNPAAAGANALIADGAHPLLEPADVLVALGLSAGAVAARMRSAPLDADAAAALEACAGEAATADQVAARSGLSLERVAAALRSLDRSGHVEHQRGYWWPV